VVTKGHIGVGKGNVCTALDLAG